MIPTNVDSMNNNITYTIDGSILYNISNVLLQLWYHCDIISLCNDINELTIMSQMLSFVFQYDIYYYLIYELGITDIPPPYTMFAPNNIGFINYGTSELDILQQPDNINNLKLLLENHIAIGMISYNDLLNLTNITMINGNVYPIYIIENNIPPTLPKPFIQIGNGPIINSNHYLTNDGMVHIIEDVLTNNDTNATNTPTSTTYYPTKAPTLSPIIQPLVAPSSSTTTNNNNTTLNSENHMVSWNNMIAIITTSIMTTTTFTIVLLSLL